ncbi:hypothetical protein X801_08033, partial [Opisthorchis viverrini]
MRTRSHGKTEDEPAASGGSFWSLCYRMLQSFFSLLSSVISAGFIHIRPPPTIPPPDKFCMADTSEFIQLFPASEQKRVLLSLLDGEARDIVRDKHILKDGVTEDVFERLCACLIERIHPVEHQYRFQSRIQLSGERMSNFVRELRRIIEDAFPDGNKRSLSRSLTLPEPLNSASGFWVVRLTRLQRHYKWRTRRETSWASCRGIENRTRHTSPPSTFSSNNKADVGHQPEDGHTIPCHCALTDRTFTRHFNVQPRPTFRDGLSRTLTALTASASGHTPGPVDTMDH